MAQPHKNLVEIHRVGRNTRERMVGGDTVPELSLHRIVLAGISETGSEFQFVRRNPNISQILACTRGQGRVWVDGKWMSCREGQVYVTPAKCLHAYEALPRSPWELGWVMYDEPPESPPLVNISTPMLVNADPRPLFASIEGLWRESITSHEPGLLQHWSELIHGYVLRITERWQQDDRLWKLWQKVDADLAHSWTLAELARSACVSEEHLRRLTQEQTGHSPMQHVAFLRIKRAATLLATPQNSLQKIESIASAVGYQNPFSFSSAFRQWMGRPPSAFRKRQSNSRSAPPENTGAKSKIIA